MGDELQDKGPEKEQIMNQGMFNDAIYCMKTTISIDDNNLNDEEDIDDEFEDESSLKSV